MGQVHGMTHLFPGETIGSVEAYCGDDYPREGCAITVKIGGAGFVVEMRAPALDTPIEVYGCRDPKSMLLVVECLAAGRLVPKGYNRGDQSDFSGSMSTS
ncbi:hypothetical protein [Burkholderia gladioli]|uniref:hypothetical protein n=1 Tax=Burkholderia gladioli TaxID=28095 RepID=UPI000BBCFA7B|nr:hypothetical protein [Burkholderia gladioli]ATF84588.1 hypothetical protein CO712_05655 [Burkholderia gladioli pv. gladioli]